MKSINVLFAEQSDQLLTEFKERDFTILWMLCLTTKTVPEVNFLKRGPGVLFSFFQIIFSGCHAQPLVKETHVS